MIMTTKMSFVLRSEDYLGRRGLTLSSIVLFIIIYIYINLSIFSISHPNFDISSFEPSCSGVNIT
jgi:hypothetical protein